jgi:hypothetical protein
MRVAGFCGPCAVWVYFCCCRGGHLCQGLQGAGGLYSWYSRLVSGWCVGGWCGDRLGEDRRER